VCCTPLVTFFVRSFHTALTEPSCRPTSTWAWNKDITIST